MRRNLLALEIVVVGLVLAGCGRGHTGTSGSLTSMNGLGSGAVPAIAGGGPTIDWDHPLANGMTTNLSALTTNATGQGLMFSPKVPAFSAKLRNVDVTDQRLEPPQGRGVAFIFDFSGDPRFPSDTRVYVNEQPSRGTEADMEAMVQNPPGPPGDFSLAHANGVTFLLIQDSGIGRAEFINNGVTFDVTGPAVPPNVALDLAIQLSQQGA